jgi:hypothetical protein
MMPAVLYMRRVIGMGWARNVPQLMIIGGSGVFVADDYRKRSAASNAACQSRQYFRLVGLCARCGNIALPRSPAFEESSEFIRIYFYSRRQPVNAHANRWGVRLPEDRYS